MNGATICQVAPYLKSITSARTQETTQLEFDDWVEDSLAMFDLGYLDYNRLGRIENNNGWFVCRLNADANPRVIKEPCTLRGNSINLEGTHLQEVLPDLYRQTIDVTATVGADQDDPHLPYDLRVIGVRHEGDEDTPAYRDDVEADHEYHLYATNLPRDTFAPRELAALISLHCLRIYLDTSYRMTIDLLKEMPQITGEIGLNATDLPSPSTLCKAFDRISMSVCRVLLRQSAQLHDPSKHGAIDATFYERSAASRHYCQRISYRVQKLKVTKLVDTDSQAVLDVHCSTTREGSDADLAEQIARRNAGDLRSLAADKGYDKQSLRTALRELGIRPLIKHRIFAPVRPRAQRQNRPTALQSALDDRDCQLGCQALARLRRVSAVLVP